MPEEEQELIRQAKLQALRTEVEQGIQSGPSIPMEKMSDILVQARANHI